jgi:hypothetical protein
MTEQESDCEYRKTCHFYNMKNMTPANKRLKELYCLEWPLKCAINQAKAVGRPVSITLWPTGKLRG